MKNYHIVKPYSDNPNCIRIYNDDPSPTIRWVECRFYHSIKPGVGEKLWGVEIKLKNETAEIRKKFGGRHLRMGCEILFNQNNMENIISYFKVIQEIDPLPLKAISEIMNLIDYDLSELLELMKKSKSLVDAKILTQAQRTEDQWPGFCPIGKIPGEILSTINDYVLGTHQYSFFFNKVLNEENPQPRLNGQLVSYHCAQNSY